MEILDFPTYTVFKDGVNIGEISRDNRNGSLSNIQALLLLQNFPLLSSFVVQPSPLSRFGNGDISLDWTALEFLGVPEFISFLNITIPPSVNQSNLRDFVFESILGNWTCVATNRLGSDSATTLLGECSKHINPV